MSSKSIASVKNFGCFTFFFAMVFFFYHLTNIDQPYFDEVHYVPAAQQWLKMAPVSNTEHPPLGKYLIATSMKFFGDNPIGWRSSSAIAGSVAILLCYLISVVIFEDLVLSLTIGLFSLFNFWFYVQSRIAMLDIFMVTFFLAGIYYFLKYKYKSKRKVDFYLSSFFLGLAVAIKWSAVFIYFPFFIICLVAELDRPFEKKMILKTLVHFVLFALFSIGIYFISFIPYMFVSSPEKRSFYQIIFSLPTEMLGMQVTVGSSHPYSSLWYTWPIILRPIWYDFSQSADKSFFKGVVLLGNPWQMGLGIIAVIGLSLRWLKLQGITRFSLVIFLCSWLAWAIIPRKISFFYYFFPSAVFYSFLIPMALREVFALKSARNIMIIITLISCGFFCYFYPILSGTWTPEKIREDWYWFRSWV